jgi:hypothetical protein
MRRHHRLLGVLPCVVCALTLAANFIHALVHGTPLDGGALDMGVSLLNNWAANLAVLSRS